MTDRAAVLQLLLELRQAGVCDNRVLAAIEAVPREYFVPEIFQARAWENTALPIGQHQTISQPQVVALMTQALDIGERMKILEVGTGSGYQAAILARLCRRVYSIERHAPLLAEAEARFRALRIHNITAKIADGMKGWREQAPFDRIMITAAAPTIPDSLVGQMIAGGIMVLPVGDQFSEQEILRLRRTHSGYKSESLSAVRFVPLLPGVATSAAPG
ncbi:MAG: protein-L-isoaspartate(D-aspartate) O-methyltransferase [Magnetospiraceae bacterium]